MDTESEEDETESTQNPAMERRKKDTKIWENIEQNMDSEALATPSGSGRYTKLNTLWICMIIIIMLHDDMYIV